jgi:CubicO group peptidase (beta-lactamase class C family)
MVEILHEQHVSSGFEAVADVFLRHCREGREVGAAVVAYVGGERVIALSGGTADRHRARPFLISTPIQVFSCTKGMVAIAVHRAVEAGILSYEMAIADLWPEFARASKDGITLEMTLAHRSGVAILEADLTLDDLMDWETVTAATAEQRPMWEPGSRHGYHLRTFGWIHGEILRRAYGKSPAQVLHDELVQPLNLDLSLVVDDALEVRLGDLVTDPPRVDVPQAVAVGRSNGVPELLLQAAFGPSQLFAYDQRWNERAYRQLAMPSSSAVCTAEALATLYHAVVSDEHGPRLLAPETVRHAIVPRSRGMDEVLGVETAFGLGFALAPMLGESLPSTAFGHPGAGGSLGFADAELELGFGYVMNRMASATEGDTRSHELASALYRCLS